MQMIFMYKVYRESYAIIEKTLFLAEVNNTYRINFFMGFQIAKKSDLKI
jgi:hypothetical protein